MAGAGLALGDVLPPVTITGADTDVSLIGPTSRMPQPFAYVQNESQYLLKCDAGNGSFYVRPWGEKVARTDGARHMTVHPIALASPLPPAPVSSLLVTVGEDFSDVMPLVADRQSSTFNTTTPLVVNPGDPQPYTVTSTGLKTFAFPILAGTQSVRLQIAFGGITFTGWKVFGDVSQALGNYWSLPDQATATNTGFDITFRLHPVDKVLTFTFNATALGAGTFTFLAEANVGVGDLVAEIGGAQGTSTAQPFTVNNVNAADWQAALNIPVAFGGALVAGVANRQQVIGGQAGKTIKLRAVNVTLSALVAGTLFLCDGDPNAGGVVIGSVAMGVGNPGPIPLDGSPLTTGNGFFVYVDVANTIRGTGAYSQR